MNWIQHKIKNIVIIALGLILVLVWWTMRKPATDTTPQLIESKIPEIFFEGGPRTLVVTAMSTKESVMNVSLHSPKPNSPQVEDRSQVASEEMGTGSKTWTIHFPADANSGLLELDSKNPTLGDNINWTITLDGKIIQQDQISWDQPANPNSILFLKFDLGNVLAAKYETPVSEPAPSTPAATVAPSDSSSLENAPSTPPASPAPADTAPVTQ